MTIGPPQLSKTLVKETIKKLFYVLPKFSALYFTNINYLRSVQDNALERKLRFCILFSCLLGSNANVEKFTFVLSVESW